MKLKLFILSGGFFVCLSLSGCNKDELEGGVLKNVVPYFPDAAIYKVDRRLLWIQTKVDGIGSQTAAAIFEQASLKATYPPGKAPLFRITQLMNIDNRSLLIIGFRKYVVAWEVRDGVDQRGIPRYKLMTWQEAPAWFMQHLGYRPTPEKIQVETLQDIQNTPKGQPMQLQTLAQIQAVKKRQQEQQLKDLILREKVDESAGQ